MREVVRFIYRNKTIELRGDQPKAMLLDWLRLDAGAMGTKEGCAEGDCGACTVVLERYHLGSIQRSTVNACILMTGQIDGARVVTIEDLATSHELHPVQEAMVRHHGSQCGFCTPGIVMSLYQLQTSGSRPVSRENVCDQLAGNLCRCTGYRPIIDAALEACSYPAVVCAAHHEVSANLDDGDDIFTGDDHSFFAAPASEESLLKLYAAHPDANLVAGGTDFGLTITKQLASSPKIISLNRITSLAAVTAEQNRLMLGACVTLAEVRHHLAAIAPDLSEMMRRFGSVQIRNSGTIGGNIANGSPIGDLAPCLIALGATLELRSPKGTRTLELEDFFLAYKRQNRHEGEFLRQINVPKPNAETAIKVFKISKRRDEDISSVLAAFAITKDGSEIIAARAAFGGMAGIPARAKLTESALVGTRLDDPATWAPALTAIDQEFTPLSDHRASALYRKTVARNILQKMLLELASGSTTETRITTGGAHV